MIGRSIAHYEIRAELGAGGMGVVYRAHDTRLGRDVALKMLLASVAADPDRRARFEREARAVAALSHPNIVTLFSVEEADGHHFLTMELVSGRPLNALLADGPLAAAALLAIAVPLADAVAAAHAGGVIHRDLKPHNVMLDAAGRVKVLDFGLARLWEGGGDAAPTVAAETARTAEGAVLGTLGYMSPEQARGRAVDARSDLFSLGVLLYELATGRHPFRADSALATAAAILRDDPPAVTELAPDLPPDLARILRRCLAKDPERRYQTARDLCNDLEDLRDALPRREGPDREVASTSDAAAAGAAEPGSLSARLSRSGPDAVERPGIAIMNFVEHTGDPEHAWLASGLPSMLITGLAQKPGLEVVAPERIQELARELGHGGEGAVAPALLAEIGRRAGADAVATGSVFKLGERHRIDLRIADVATGRLLLGETVAGEDVFALVDTLTARVARALDVDADSDAPGVAKVSTPSIEAYREYELGVNAHRDYVHTEARDHLLRAVAIDPDFASAHLLLMRVFENLGDRTRSRVHEDRAFELQARLPERERLLFLAQKLRHSEPRRTVALLEELLARFPDTEDGYIYLSISKALDLMDRDGWRDAVDRGIRALPDSPEMRNMRAYTQPYYGSYEEALADLEEYQRLSPAGTTNPIDSLAEVSLIFGRVQEALDLYERIDDAGRGYELVGKSYCLAVLGRYPAALAAMRRHEEIRAEQGVALPYAMFLVAFYLAQVGRFREAGEAIGEGLARCARADHVSAELSLELLSASIGLARGRPADVIQGASRARKLADRLGASLMNQVFHEHALYLMGVSEALAGRLDSAEEFAAEQRAQRAEPVPEGEHYRYWLTGEIALARGDIDGAERAFAAGPDRKPLFGFSVPGFSVFHSNPVLRDWPARIAARRGDAEGALSLYRGLVTPHADWKYTAVLEPRYLLAMSRLALAAASPREAADLARRFLALWDGADPGSPELAEAERLLAEAGP